MDSEVNEIKSESLPSYPPDSPTGTYASDNESGDSRIFEHFEPYNPKVGGLTVKEEESIDGSEEDLSEEEEQDLVQVSDSDEDTKEFKKEHLDASDDHIKEENLINEPSTSQQGRRKRRKCDLPSVNFKQNTHTSKDIAATSGEESELITKAWDLKFKKLKYKQKLKAEKLIIDVFQNIDTNTTKEGANNEDSEDIGALTKGWARKFSKLSKMQRTIAEKLITDVFFYGTMDSLKPESSITP